MLGRAFRRSIAGARRSSRSTDLNRGPAARLFPRRNAFPPPARRRAGAPALPRTRGDPGEDDAHPAVHGRGSGDPMSGEDLARAQAILSDLCFAPSARHPEDRIRDHLELDPIEIAELELQLRSRHHVHLDLWEVYDHTLAELAARLARCTAPPTGPAPEADR